MLANTEIKLDSQKVDILRQYHMVVSSDTSWFGPSVLCEVPFVLSDIKDRAAFKERLPEGNTPSIRKWDAFDKVFDCNGVPRNPAYAGPLKEFSQTVLAYERAAGFDPKSSLYMLWGTTQKRYPDTTTGQALPHRDTGNPTDRNYVLSDEVAGMSFGNGFSSRAFGITCFDGATRHWADPVRQEFGNQPYLLRNLAQIIVRRGQGKRLIRGLRTLGNATQGRWPVLSA